MERRDLIKDQIEELGRVLGKILADLVGFASKGEVSKSLEIAREQFIEKLDLDLDELFQIDERELKNHLLEKKFTADHIEVLSSFFEESAKLTMIKHPIKAKSYFQMALRLLDISEEVSQSVSFDRLEKINSLQKLMEECHQKVIPPPE